ncbi:LysR family transcriptional regulator [Novosphingobium resinovorum]|uniref:LysR family transcriptional regulator n=1 Tax=Novosphingobium resinovorum TaxID=158500 RepID=UPI0018D44D85|nr:LysR family transcriptional regulator [Novosphingobium resinovorum]
MDRSPLISIKQLRAIGAVADNASLVRASRQLAISQSSLSRQIDDAERAFGRTLFQRGWNGMEPTSAGIVVITHARRMMARIVQCGEALAINGVRTGDLGYHLTWFILDVLDAVRHAGSASAAANSLGISQPTVSRTLAQAGAAIGQPPFLRTATGMTATSSVPVLCALRDDLHVELATMTAALASLDGQVTGRVAVGLLPFSEQGIVVETFAILTRDYPHLQLQAVTGSYTALTEALRRGEIDMILGPLRGDGAIDWLQEHPLLEEHLTLLVRPRHPLADRRADCADLVAASWVVGPHGTPTRRFFEAFFLGRGMAPPAQICEMVTFPLAEDMIRQSDAIGLLTYSRRQREALRNRLQTLSSDFPDAVRQIGISMHRSRPSSTQHELFRSVLIKTLEGAK